MREKEFWQNECKCGEKMYITEVDMAEGIFWKSCPKYMDGDDSHDSFSSSIVPANNDGLYADFYRALEIIVGSEIDYEGKGEDRDWLTNELLNVKSIGELEMNMARLNTNWKNFFVGENCKEFQKWYQEFVADGGNTLLELPLENSDDKFARKLGFTDYSELCEKSEIVYEEPGDVTWYVTELPDGRWAAWDDAEVSADRVAYCDSRDEAVAWQEAGKEIVEASEPKKFVLNLKGENGDIRTGYEEKLEGGSKEEVVRDYLHYLNHECNMIEDGELTEADVDCEEVDWE